jgi:hypothetical protein
MEKKFVVKDFESQKYYCGELMGWSEISYLSDYFDDIESAINFINSEQGKFQIEEVYIVI